MIQFDLASDLHIDHWDPQYSSPDQIGEKKDFPMIWEPTSDILVIAGDVSDNIENSYKYMKKLRRYYKDIIFIDGNHEHYPVRPYLLDTTLFPEYKNIHYLGKRDVVVGKTVFIGVCGWWDWSLSQPDPVISPTQTQKILERGRIEADRLEQKIKNWGSNPEVDEIVIVTHTVPRARFARYVDTDHNSRFGKLNSHWLHTYGMNKITRWVFGHNHKNFNDVEDGILFQSNPRGRPVDFDREEYSQSPSPPPPSDLLGFE